jgi:outer membrane lipoprotein carrier protein
LILAGTCLALPVRADAVQALRDFGREVKTARGTFTQTVTSPDGRRKSSSGSFEFWRPDRFRFTYTRPFEQSIVADGQKVWIHDPELKQATSRRMPQALGATPAALLAGGAIERDFTLTAEPSRDGLDWVLATPRQADGAVRSLRAGFRGRELAALEVVDGFGQRSLLRFADLRTNAPPSPDAFRFVPPAGTDVLEQ